MTDAAEIRELIEQERARFDVPGMGVVVVADGEVLLAEGFGHREVEEDLPVTEKTLFRIASDTKCFTAAAVLALVDDGLLDLDRPVREYIPWFEMHDPIATSIVSARDLLSHRTGLPRHDFLRYGSEDLSREEIVRRLRYLPLSKQPRQEWQYNNLCYETAGYLTEVLVGKTWSQAVRDLLLDPLGMSSTVFRPEEAEATSDVAIPYQERDGVNRRVTRDYRGGKEGGPAGGIISSPADMASWVLARLGIEVDGKRVLSHALLAQLHRPVMHEPPRELEFPEVQAIGYAMGCEVESYRGHRFIRHGGNLIGFSSDVCVAPDANAAVVVLTNAHGTLLRDALPYMVLDRVLELPPIPWGERYYELQTAALGGFRESTQHHLSRGAGKPPSRPLAEFAGRYAHPAYGTFEVTVEGEALVPSFHGVGGLELRHRNHDSWDLWIDDFEGAVPLAFQGGLDGEIESMIVPMEPNVDPIRFDRVHDVVLTTEQARRLAGSYSMGPLTLEVEIKNDADLTANIPGTGVEPLQPLSELVFRVAGPPLLRVEFITGEDGSVDRVVIDPGGVYRPA